MLSDSYAPKGDNVISQEGMNYNLKASHQLLNLLELTWYNNYDAHDFGVNDKEMQQSQIQCQDNWHFEVG